jgi:hypothetical protein
MPLTPQLFELRRRSEAVAPVNATAEFDKEEAIAKPSHLVDLQIPRFIPDANSILSVKYRGKKSVPR